ncbi:MAG: hypothetical protein DRJ14_05565 [Acidobacteria bacterium]|nr:MAG: hypothetical protein DRJ14_05565 [Acidobacteriota bacterium]
MKLLKKFWPGCKPCLWVFIPMVVVFLILLPLSISPAGIRLGKMALPVRVSGDMITAVYGSIFGALLPLTTWISLILYGGVTKRPFVRLASFQSGILIIVLLPLSVKLRQLPSFHMLLVAIIFLFTLDGILQLFTWLLRDRRTGAAVAMACIQLAGPLVMYLNDFRDFFPPTLARMASISYLEFPFYQKAVALLKNGSLSPLVPDLILAAVVVAVAAALRLRRVAPDVR